MHCARGFSPGRWTSGNGESEWGNHVFEANWDRFRPLSEKNLLKCKFDHITPPDKIHQCCASHTSVNCKFFSPQTAFLSSQHIYWASVTLTQLPSSKHIVQHQQTMYHSSKVKSKWRKLSCCSGLSCCPWGWHHILKGFFKSWLLRFQRSFVLMHTGEHQNVAQELVPLPRT